MRVLELYSGIGGMHSALQMSGLSFCVIRALDINDLANNVYNYAHQCNLAKNRTLDSFSESECRSLAADLWTMSPPCQPFTRMGKCKHGDDNRASSLHVIIDLIRKLRPKFIFLENVKGFEFSDAWKDILSVLLESNYDFRQFLLTPLQFGVPNCRLRYYLVAQQKEASRVPSFSFGTSLPEISESHSLADILLMAAEEIITIPPHQASSMSDCSCSFCSGKTRHITSTKNHYEEYSAYCKPLSDFLLPLSDTTDCLRLSEEKTKKFLPVLDIVSASSHKSACFTKGYSQRFDGTGSFLRLESSLLESVDPTAATEDIESELPCVRYFHSQEIANLLCFPPSFEFPAYVTEKQRKRLLGNSISVIVVAHIMHWAFS